MANETKDTKDAKAFYTVNTQCPDDPEGIRQYFQKIIDVMPNNVYWLNKDCITMGCNANTLKLIGLKSLSEFVGITYEEMGRLANWTEGQAQSFKRDDMKVISSGQPIYNVEEPPLYDEQGEPVYYMSSRVPLKDNSGEIIGVVGISVDITHRKKLEKKLLQASRKVEFIATLNNTLRSPITTISMMVDMLRETGLTEEQERYLDLLAEANDSMPESLTYAGDYAKLDSGDIEFYPAPMRLLYTIDALQDRYYQRAHRKGIEFIVDYSQLTSVWLHSSVTQIKEVLHTLLDNCLQYTEKGFIKLSFQRQQSHHGKEVIICIEDTSPGFEADYLACIFSEGGLAAETDTDYPLMSMRFAFCRKMVDALDGRLWAESTKDTGARFYLAFAEGQSADDDPMPDLHAHEMVDQHRFAYIADKNAFSESFLSLFNEEAIIRVSPPKAANDIRKHLKKTEDLDMVFIDQQLAESSPELVISILNVLNPQHTLMIVLSDSAPNYVLAKLFEEHRHLTRLEKPLMWTRFYRELLEVWSAFHHQSLAVLSVEDSPIAQKALTYVLESIGCEVTAVNSGEQALALLDPDVDTDNIKGFDVVFLDIGLPGKNGIAIAEEIHQRFQSNCPPLIALTGLTRKVDLDVLYESGLFKSIIEKPATAKIIEDTLAYVFAPGEAED